MYSNAEESHCSSRKLLYFYNSLAYQCSMIVSRLFSNRNPYLSLHDPFILLFYLSSLSFYHFNNGTCQTLSAYEQVTLTQKLIRHFQNVLQLLLHMKAFIWSWSLASSQMLLNSVEWFWSLSWHFHGCIWKGVTLCDPMSVCMC